jgi:hypothetical protein
MSLTSPSPPDYYISAYQSLDNPHSNPFIVAPAHITYSFPSPATVIAQNLATETQNRADEAFKPVCHSQEWIELYRTLLLGENIFEVKDEGRMYIILGE